MGGSADSRRGRRAGSEERKGSVRAVGGLLAPLLARAARRRGFTEASLLFDWEKVVGPELAGRCMPDRIERISGGTLVLRAGSGAALELQHAAPQIVERVNAYFGRRVISRLRFLRAPVPQRTPSSSPPSRPEPSPERIRELERATAAINPEGLRRALVELGRAVMTGTAP